MFFIWTFSFSGKLKLIEENLQKLKEMNVQQLQNCLNSIEQNEQEQSMVNGYLLAKCIKQSFFFSKFYVDQFNKIQQSIDQIDMKCSDYVRELDQRLLENYQEAKQNNIQDQEILDYILNQQGYIEKSVDKLIKEKVEDKYEQQLRQELNIFLHQVFNNISIIYNITKQQDKDLKSKDYFKIDGDNKDNCDSKLFELICKCIQGEGLTNKQLKNIRNKQRKIFNQNYQPIKSPIQIRINDSRKRIPLLKPFIQELFETIGEEIQKSQIEFIVLSNFQIQEHLNRVKQNTIGCQSTCPMCKRKCDQQSDQDHQHSCSNGHLLRGMVGVLVKNSPVLCSCSEIYDDSLVKTLDSTLVNKWRDIKMRYPKWCFENLCDQKERMPKTWNNGIGQLVCQHFSYEYIELQIKIDFNKQKDQSQSNNQGESQPDEKDRYQFIGQVQSQINQNECQSAHYFMMLDDSGSMYGQRWENAKECAIEGTKAMARNEEPKVSVIIFGDDARVVIDCERVNIDKQQDLITCESSGTCFNNAFLKAYDQLIKHGIQNEKIIFNENIIIFYTDGAASYPAEAVQNFRQLEPNLKKTIQLISCSEGDVNQIESLVKLIDNFKKSGIKACLKTNIEAKDFFNQM